jgi:hypothetical protein
MTTNTTPQPSGRGSKKLATAVLSVTLAAILAVGGTFAYTSMRQVATNEAPFSLTNGVRLHNDYKYDTSVTPGSTAESDFAYTGGQNAVGANHDIYVENYGDRDLYLRVKLYEYNELDGTPAKADTAADKPLGDGGSTPAWDAFIIADKTDAVGAAAVTHYDAWAWTMGSAAGSYYMPTNNKADYDSNSNVINATTADVTYLPEQPDNSYDVGLLPTASDPDLPYSPGVYDTVDAESDTNPDADDVGAYSADDMGYDPTATDGKELLPHNAYGAGVAASPVSEVAAMANYKTDIVSGTVDNTWVCDTDGWWYWSQPLAPGAATGLLLDEVKSLYDITKPYKYGIYAVVEAAGWSELFGQGVQLSVNDAFTVAGSSKPTADAFDMLAQMGAVEAAYTINYNKNGVSTPVTLNDVPTAQALSVSMTDNYTFTDANNVAWRLLWKKANGELIITQEMPTTTARALGASTAGTSADYYGSAVDTYLNGDYKNALDDNLRSLIIPQTYSISQTGSPDLVWYTPQTRDILLPNFSEFNLNGQVAEVYCEPPTTGSTNGRPNAMTGNLVPGQLLFPTNESAICNYSGGGGWQWLAGKAWDSRAGSFTNTTLNSATGALDVSSSTATHLMRPIMVINGTSPNSFTQH